MRVSKNRLDTRFCLENAFSQFSHFMKMYICPESIQKEIKLPVQNNKFHENLPAFNRS